MPGSSEQQQQTHGRFGRLRAVIFRSLPLVAVAAATFVGTYAFLGGDEELDPDSTTFHDMRVRTHEEFTGLIDPEAPEVRELARRLGTPEAAYLHVRDRIGYAASLPLTNPVETLKAGTGSCLSKAALLASLYRAQGMPDQEVRVVTGQAYWQDQIVEHAWLELEHDGRCLQQDPTSFFGTFAFDQFPGTDYTKAYVRREFFCFNDKGFAVVSLNNRFRGMTDPHQAAVPAP